MKKFNTYIPLHIHSTYSVGDGVSKIDDIVNKAKEIGAPGISITEHGTLSSFYKFYNSCKHNAINPIIGIEFYINDLYFNDNKKFLELKRNKNNDSTEGDLSDLDKSDAANSHLIVYAKNYNGLKNLIHLSNIAFQNFYYKPLLSTDLLFSILDENNIVTTGCAASMFNKLILKNKFNETIDLIKKFKNKFKDDFYFEIQLHNLPEQIKINNFYKKIYQKINIKPILALDAHYCNKEDWELQYLLYVIKQRETINTLPKDKWFYSVRDLYIRNIDEIYDKASEINIDIDFLNIAINSTFELNNKIKIEIPKYIDNFPKFFNNYDESVNLFKQKIDIKWNEKIKNGLIPKEKIKIYKERLDYELDLMIKKHYVDYFLILDDLLNNFVYKNNGATGAGRGSAGGSLVLFVLDITKIDPIRYNLIFARFINEARIDPPDVDCLINLTMLKTENGYKTIDKININDIVYDANNNKQKILNITKRDIKNTDIVYEVIFKNGNEYGSLILNSKHKLILDNGIEILAENLKIGNKLKSYSQYSNDSEIILINIIENNKISKDIYFVDIEVENSHTFQVVPFSVKNNKTEFLNQDQNYNVDIDLKQSVKINI